jgi:hypothetical protein
MEKAGTRGCTKSGQGAVNGVHWEENKGDGRARFGIDEFGKRSKTESFFDSF